MLVRISFSKHGVIKYIGHLDLMRYFQKAFRRTDINVLYSKGFSPHMIMSFAQPLGVGIESDKEYFDVEVFDDEDVTLFPSKLNEEMADGIVVLDAVKMPEKTKNAMASVAAADYEITFFKNNPLSDSLLEKYKNNESVTYTKTTKTGDHSINVKDFVFDFDIINENILFIKCDASSAGNLKPKSFVTALLSLEDKNAEDYPIHVLRKDLYKYDSKGNLVSLNNIDE